MESIPDRDLRRRFGRAKLAASLILVAAFVGQVLARKQFRAAIPGERTLPVLLFAGATLVFVFACCLMARVKGRSSWFGLLGLLNFVGYFFILLMKKACHRCGFLARDSAEECPRCSAPV